MKRTTYALSPKAYGIDWARIGLCLVLAGIGAAAVALLAG